MYLTMRKHDLLQIECKFHEALILGNFMEVRRINKYKYK